MVKLELDLIYLIHIMENRCEHVKMENWESPVKRVLTPFLYSPSLQKVPFTSIFALFLMYLLTYCFFS